jgi:hypothetical protein
MRAHGGNQADLCAGGNAHTGYALIRYDAMCSAIAAAHEVDEVKDIRDKAIAIEAYSRQARNTEAEWEACEIRLRAERKCGQLLAEREKAKGAAGNPGGRGAPIVPPQDGSTQPKTLEQLGVSKRQSERWQNQPRLSPIVTPELWPGITDNDINDIDSCSSRLLSG